MQIDATECKCLVDILVDVLPYDQHSASVIVAQHGRALSGTSNQQAGRRAHPEAKTQKVDAHAAAAVGV